MVHELGAFLSSILEQLALCFNVEQLKIEQEKQGQTPSIFVTKFKLQQTVFAGILCHIYLIR